MRPSAHRARRSADAGGSQGLAGELRHDASSRRGAEHDIGPDVRRRAPVPRVVAGAQVEVVAPARKRCARDAGRRLLGVLHLVGRGRRELVPVVGEAVDAAALVEGAAPRHHDRVAGRRRADGVARAHRGGTRRRHGVGRRRRWRWWRRGGSRSGAISTLYALTRPSVAILPTNAGSGSTVRMREYLTWAGVAAGSRARSSAATPATCGEAIDVPLTAA